MSGALKTGLTVKFPNCAGIDIAKNLHYVALKFNDQGERTVEHFEGFTEDLERMSDWRTQNGVEQVAMEATGVYWQCSVRAPLPVHFSLVQRQR